LHAFPSLSERSLGENRPLIKQNRVMIKQNRVTIVRSEGGEEHGKPLPVGSGLT
jgi:hypothetical protein